MNRFQMSKEAVLTALAVASGAVTRLFGGWDMTLQVLVGFMAADYLTGLVVAGVFRCSTKSITGALESRAGFQGLMRKGGILLLVYLAVLLDRAAGADLIRGAVCCFFIANEGLSILENLGLMGVPYPDMLKNALELLRKESDTGKRGIHDQTSH